MFPRHWYDVDCLLNREIADPFTTKQAMSDVVEMKSHRWGEKGVDYQYVLDGRLRLIPDAGRLQGISKDHRDAVKGSMFFTTPDDFDQIIERLSAIERRINSENRVVDDWLFENHQLAFSGAWLQAIVDWKRTRLRSIFSLKGNVNRSLLDLKAKLQALQSDDPA